VTAADRYLRLRCMAIFALHAVLVGGFFSRIAELQRGLGFSEARFGLVLTGVPVGVLIGTFVVSRLAERLGTRRLMMTGFMLFAVMPPLAALAPGFGTFYLSLIGFGLFLSLANIGMNVEADRIGLATGKPMLSAAHGCWGIGFLITAALSAGAIRIGIPPLTQFLAMLAGLLIAVATLIRALRESPPRRHDRAGPPPRFALPDRMTFLVMAWALSGFVIEGVTRNWSVIYLRDTLGAADWIAALTLPALMATQTAGRFLADAAVARIGEVGLGRVLAVISALGLTALAFSTSVPVALAGCFLIGLGISINHPMAIGAVARQPGRPSSESVAALASLQTLIGFVSPTFFGLISAAGGMRMAFAVLLPLALMSWWFARVLAPAPLAAPPVAS
jgi:Na+/melibiose symporter-like transporter